MKEATEKTKGLEDGKVGKSGKEYMFSNERTWKLKVEDLEYENAKLRKEVEDRRGKLQELESERKEY